MPGIRLPQEFTGNKEPQVPHSDELDSRDVLSVSGLNIAFHHEGQQVDAVRNVSVLIHLKYEKNREDIGLFGIWRD